MLIPRARAIIGGTSLGAPLGAPPNAFLYLNAHSTPKVPSMLISEPLLVMRVAGQIFIATPAGGQYPHAMIRKGT